MSRPTIERPIRSIGRFYAKLPAADKTFARKLARNACRLPKHELETEYYRLKGIAEHANYL